MKTRMKIVAALATLAALIPATNASADNIPASGCSPASASTQSGAAEDHVELVGDGPDDSDFSCYYEAAGRGGITAVTPNEWTVEVVVAGPDGTVGTKLTSDGGSVQSTGNSICPGDIVKVTFKQAFETPVPNLPPGIYGVIRAGGAGAAPNSCSGT